SRRPPQSRSPRRHPPPPPPSLSPRPLVLNQHRHPPFLHPGGGLHPLPRDKRCPHPPRPAARRDGQGARRPRALPRPALPSGLRLLMVDLHNLLSLQPVVCSSHTMELTTTSGDLLLPVHGGVHLPFKLQLTDEGVFLLSAHTEELQ
uniref:Uncharacterized protein n=1 Tax=Triticum urartu TaxID=4572 RepID=A0A8R7TU48_TRIUA